MSVRKLLKPYLQPAFLVCVAVLAVAGVSKEAVIEYIGIITVKERIDLKKPFSELDELQLGPYKVLQRHLIKNPDVLEELGTDEYIQWFLEDSEVDKHSPVRYCTLFLTYYTGNPDQIPHVPEECQLGAGNVREKAETVNLNCSMAGDPSREVAIRHLVFKPGNVSIWQPASKFSVMYLFRVNGLYAAGRNEVRAITARNWLGKYSYFSKVEWNIFGKGYGNVKTRGSRDEVVAASEKLLSVIIPLLETEHWPDWQQGEDVKETADEAASSTANVTELN